MMTDNLLIPEIVSDLFLVVTPIVVYINPFAIPRIFWNFNE